MFLRVISTHRRRCAARTARPPCRRGSGTCSRSASPPRARSARRARTGWARTGPAGTALLSRHGHITSRHAMFVRQSYVSEKPIEITNLCANCLIGYNIILSNPTKIMLGTVRRKLCTQTLKETGPLQTARTGLSNWFYNSFSHWQLTGSWAPSSCNACGLAGAAGSSPPQPARVRTLRAAFTKSTRLWLIHASFRHPARNIVLLMPLLGIGHFLHIAV